MKLLNNRGDRNLTGHLLPPIKLPVLEMGYI